MKVIREKFKSAERVKAFDGFIPFDKGVKVDYKEQKAPDGEAIEDYRDVVFEGYASTWNNIDRDGEAMQRGAFSKTIQQFMRNPIALKDHRQGVDFIVGHYEVLKEDARGLFVRCRISNAPDCKSVRFKIAEGSLRAMSVAGIMYLEENGINIKEVVLWEISVVAVPANPESLIDTVIKMRDLTDEDRKKYFLETADSSDGREPEVKEAKPRGLKVRGTNLTITR